MNKSSQGNLTPTPLTPLGRSSLESQKHCKMKHREFFKELIHRRNMSDDVRSVKRPETTVNGKHEDESQLAENTIKWNNIQG